MSRELWRKAELIRESGAAQPSSGAKMGEQPPAIALPVARPKTAPGGMASFMAQRSEIHKEADALRQRLKEFDGASPSRLLDPKEIAASEWSNRSEESYSTAEFLTLKEEIASAGGNVVPIKVRPRTPREGDVTKYELVYGHRRHRACLILGLLVQGIVAEMSDQALYEEMERENRGREDLSPWEQGMAYARALEKGLYPSNKQLALAIGADATAVGKALALAKLPADVVGAFRSPLDLQYRWSGPLKDALQKDPEAVLARAKQIRQMEERPLSRNAFPMLLGEVPISPEGKKEHAPTSRDLSSASGSRVGTISVGKGGRTVVTLVQPLSESRIQELERLLQGFLAPRGKKNELEKP